MASGVRPATETEAGGLPAAGVGVGGFGVAGDEKPWGAGAAGRDGRLGPACEVGGFGALGSRKNQAARRKRLAEAGLDDTAIARLHGPVGLDIGALTAPEIAVSILAEIVERWRRPSVG